MRSQDRTNFQNIAATTSAFELKGGQYLVTAVATFSGGSVKLQILGPDGTTWIDAAAATSFTAAGAGTAYLPNAQYRIAIATATAVYVGINRVPGE